MSEQKSITLRQPDALEITKVDDIWLAGARTLKVVDQATHDRAGDLFKQITGRIKVLEKGNLDTGGTFEGFDGPIAAAHKAHKFLTSLKAAATAPYVEARTGLSIAMNGYEAESRRKAEAEARRLQEIARQEEEERRLLEAIEAEERERKATEAARAAQAAAAAARAAELAARRAGDEAARAQAAKAEEAARVARAAAEAEAVRAAAEAKAILDEKPAVPVVVVAPAFKQAAGVVTTTTWSAEVFDLRALEKYVAGNPACEHYLEAAMPVLNGLARSQHEALSIPGVRAVSKETKSARV